MAKVFEAKKNGTCVKEGDAIRAGERITKDGEGFSHADCVWPQKARERGSAEQPGPQRRQGQSPQEIDPWRFKGDKRLGIEPVEEDVQMPKPLTDEMIDAAVLKAQERIARKQGCEANMITPMHPAFAVVLRAELSKQSQGFELKRLLAEYKLKARNIAKVNGE